MEYVKKLMEEKENSVLKSDANSDSKITSLNVAKTTKLANEYENKFQKIIGDSNGDGVVNEKDYINVKNYINNVDSSEDFVFKNSDINGDGKIDDEDLKSLRDMADGLKINYSERTNLGDVNGDGIISIADVQAITNYKNRKATGKEFYINNADVNGDGKVGDFIKTGDHFILLEKQDDSLKVQYTAANGSEKIGWVHESVFWSEPDPIYPERALRTVKAYIDPELKKQENTWEQVDAGDKIIVKEKRSTSLLVEYSTSNRSHIFAKCKAM